MNTTVEIVLILVNFREASRRLVKPAGPARSYVLIASSALDNKSFVLCYQSITLITDIVHRIRHLLTNQANEDLT